MNSRPARAGELTASQPSTGASNSTSSVAMGASELAAEFREGHLDPVEVVRAYIERIQSVNPHLNALVAERFQSALKEAEHASRELKRGSESLPPLLGVPITVKDSLAVAGMPLTAGLRWRAGVQVDQDAVAVARLRSAGAIVLGKTNTPELAASVETRNFLFGRTRNPWDAHRSAGGSSGGEAALIAAGASPLGLGSDLAGSLRIPASFCGVVALKPTGGKIPTLGHLPADVPELGGWNVVGPMARSVADLELAFNVLANRAGVELPQRDYFARKVIIPRFPSGWGVAAPIREAVQLAAATLSDAGARLLQDVDLPMSQLAHAYVGAMYRHWLPDILRLLKRRSVAGLLASTARSMLGSGDVSPNVLASLSMVALTGSFVDRSGSSVHRISEQRRTILETLGRDGLIVWPVAGSMASKAGFPYGLVSGTMFSAVFNILQLPVVVVPVAWSDRNLPIGVQIVGPPNSEHFVLRAAATLETAFSAGRLANPGS